MARDGKTEAIFTTADDQMQAIWGLHRYLQAAAESADLASVIKRLPPRTYPMTHEWDRNYDPHEMAQAIDQIREFLLCRQSLVALVTVCEVALLRLNHHLVKLGKLRAPSNKNLKLLSWAFDVVKNSPLGSSEAIARLPQTCGDLDNARRLRNCIVHRNGCYDPHVYFDQAIQDGWIRPQHEKDSTTAAAKREPIFLTTMRFEYFTRSHLEFLHILHNTIQRTNFGHPTPYSYAAEHKRVEWYRLLSGRRDVNM